LNFSSETELISALKHVADWITVKVQ